MTKALHQVPIITVAANWVISRYRLAVYGTEHYAMLAFICDLNSSIFSKLSLLHFQNYPLDFYHAAWNADAVLR